MHGGEFVNLIVRPRMCPSSRQIENPYTLVSQDFTKLNIISIIAFHFALHAKHGFKRFLAHNKWVVELRIVSSSGGSKQLWIFSIVLHIFLNTS